MPNTREKEVKHCQGELFLCAVCEFSRFGENSTRIPSEKKKEVKKQKKECKTCHFTGKSNVLCTRCLKYVCSNCSGLTTDMSEMLTNSNLSVHWFCTQCKDPALKAVRTDIEIEEKCKAYCLKFKEEMQREISDEVNKVRKEVNKLNNKIEDMQKNKKEDDSRSIPSMTTSESFKELEDRAKRKTNLIVMNIPESDSEDIQEKKDHDLAEIKKVFNVMDCKDIAAEIKQVTRLGKQQTSGENKYPRLLKVVLTNEENQKEVIRKSKCLKSKEGYERVYINRDLTPLELREQKVLREELKKKRNEAGRDERWIIRNGAVVKERN